MRARELLVTRRRLAYPAALVALVLLSAGFRAWAARQVPVPWIAADEMIYGLLGFGLYHTGHLAILGGPTPFYSLLVPAFTGLPLSIGSFGFGYGLLKAVQAVAMSLAAVPVYLWGTRLVSPGRALLAAALTLAVPGLAYSGLVMTEVIFYPLLTLAAWALAAALVRPTPRAQALLVAATVVAASARLQALILLPVFAGALALHAALSRSTRTARALAPSLLVLCGLALAWFGWRLAAGRAVLGGYAGVNQASYGAGEAAKFVLYHAGALLITTAVLPVCALLVLLVEALRRGERSEAARAYLAVAASLVVFFVIEVGVFASQHVGRLAERDLIALSPILFLGFALWLERGAPRRPAATVAVAVLALAAILSLPVKRLVVDAAAPDALTLVPFIRLLHASSADTMEIVFFVGAGVAVALFALVPRRFVGLLPALLLACFVAASVSVSGYVADQAKAQQARFLGPDPGWVDHAATGPTAYLYDGEPDWTGVWETIFWNPRIDRVLDLPGALVPGPLPQREVDVAPDGRFDGPRFVVASTTFTFFGTKLAEVRQVGIQQAGLDLWRLDPPARLSTATTGILADGQVAAGGATLRAYGCTRGDFVLTLLVKQPQTVDVMRNGDLFERLDLTTPPPDGVWRGRIPAVPQDGVCELELRPSGLLGTTVFLFERR
jgi:hypothetical protein